MLVVSRDNGIDLSVSKISVFEKGEWLFMLFLFHSVSWIRTNGDWKERLFSGIGVYLGYYMVIFIPLSNITESFLYLPSFHLTGW